MRLVSHTRLTIRSGRETWLDEAAATLEQQGANAKTDGARYP